MAMHHVDTASIIEIIHSEGGFRLSLHAKVAAGYAEIVSLTGIYIELCRTLPQNQPSGESSVLAREVVELQYAVFRQKRHRAIFKFHFRAAIVRRHNVALPYGQIEHRSFPIAMPVGQRVTLHVARETHISLDKAQPNDPSVARVRIRNCCATCGNQRYTGNGCKKTTKAGHCSPPGGACSIK